MVIIPVIDILGGRAVHAQCGQRQHYQPLKTSLAVGDSPDSIIQSFIALFPCNTIYLADLDAIQGQGDNRLIISALTATFTSVTFWVDQGLCTHETRKTTPVIGSETLITPEDLHTMKISRPDSILSLDFIDDRLRGDPRLLDCIDAWPATVIIMNLTRVGTRLGPDYRLIKRLCDSARERQIFIAGGIRNEEDLKTLQEMNITGVLLATALHSGTLDADILTRYSN